MFVVGYRGASWHQVKKRSTAESLYNSLDFGPCFRYCELMRRDTLGIMTSCLTAFANPQLTNQLMILGLELQRGVLSS
jgi:hypothetical protein